MKIALLAGTQSGCGKTTVMLAVLQYFRQQNLAVTAFKAGPDFLDPLWHQALTGKKSYNLDTRMVGITESQCLLAKHTKNTDFTLIEGVMGMFDGRSGVGQEGSSAHLASVLDLPVILVVDAKGMSGSIVPLVQGFSKYAQQQGVVITGVIANRVGSEYHAQLLRELLHEHHLPGLLAWLGKNCPVLPERHLGLVRPGEADIPILLDHFHVDSDVFTAAFKNDSSQPVEQSNIQARLLGKTIGIARDDACCFIYPANLDWLVEQGATLQFFSPLADESVPKQADAVWLPGGYPELYAEKFSSLTNWKTSIVDFIESGKPLLAECGGMMMLADVLTDHDGKSWPMAGVLAFATRMQNRLASLGYRETAAGIRGHEFHHSKRENEQEYSACFDVSRGDQGVRYKNLRASYIHWYFASAPELVKEWFS